MPVTIMSNYLWDYSSKIESQRSLQDFISILQQLNEETKKEKTRIFAELKSETIVETGLAAPLVRSPCSFAAIKDMI